MVHTDKIGRAGGHYVAAELDKRGAYASPFSSNVPGTNIVETDSERMDYTQVKTQGLAKNRWPVSLKYGWTIPRGVACLCIDSCDPTCCKEAIGEEPNNPHDPIATNLLPLPEVEARQDRYRVFVPLEELNYWIVPDDELRELFRRQHIKYLRERGGHRSGSKHASLDNSLFASALVSCRGRWSVLGLCLQDSGVC